MSTSVFIEKEVEPDEASLTEALGQTGVYREALSRYLETEYGPLVEKWKYYGQKSGWLLKTLRKKRNLFFLIPLQGYFRVIFVFGDKAVSAVEQSDLPGEIVETLKNARKYAEGRGLSIDVKGPEDLEHVKKLVGIKVNS